MKDKIGREDRSGNPYSNPVKLKARKTKHEELTKEQIELGAKYLAMSNMCTLDRFRKSGQIKDLSSLKRSVQEAWEMAVTGFMESGPNGYDDSLESEAIAGVEEEIDSFRQDLKAGGKRAVYWIESLKKEVPFLFKQ